MDSTAPKLANVLCLFLIIGLIAGFLPYPELPTLPTVIRDFVQQEQ